MLSFSVAHFSTMLEVVKHSPGSCKHAVDLIKSNRVAAITKRDFQIEIRSTMLRVTFLSRRS